jgi:hypothetical protein
MPRLVSCTGLALLLAGAFLLTDALTLLSLDSAAVGPEHRARGRNGQHPLPCPAPHLGSRPMTSASTAA